jgi:hypothetical protein
MKGYFLMHAIRDVVENPVLVFVVLLGLGILLAKHCFKSPWRGGDE